MTPFEREVRLATVAPAAAIPPATEELCRWLLAPGEAGTPLVPAGLAGRLKGVLAARLGEGGGSARQVVAAFRDLIPSGSAPILIVSSGAAGPDSAGRIASAATSLADLAAAQPGMTLVLAIEPGDLECYLRLAPESRAKALVRTGVIRLDTPGVREIRERLEASLPGSSRRLADSVRRLSADGVSDRLADLFVEAVRETEAPPPVEPGTGDRARSAAERFLYDRLESLPETTGVFTLNGTLDIPFGPSRAMEVDLLSPTLDLAVEVDGYYHFREAEAFRRDRRKDFELQRRGYLVVRVLAEDVVGRLEEVLELILAAVATRRDRGARPRGEIP